VNRATPKDPLAMSNLQEPKDQAVAPVTSMFAKTATLNVGQATVIEEARDPTFQ
jgi:hypothetical protein